MEIYHLKLPTLYWYHRVIDTGKILINHHIINYKKVRVAYQNNMRSYNYV